MLGSIAYEGIKLTVSQEFRELNLRCLIVGDNASRNMTCNSTEQGVAEFYWVTVAR
jgi:hypothetical protein